MRAGLYICIAASLVFLPVKVSGITVFHDTGEPAVLAGRMASEMNDDELLGQLFFLTYSGDRPDPDFLYWVRERKIGGVKIFGWNAENLGRLSMSISALQGEASKKPRRIPLIIAPDQEGGWVLHVKGTSSVTPGNLAIGSSGFIHDAYETGFYLGQELAALGINMNFAPTVDIYTDLGQCRPRAF